ncbi:MAG: NAD(P)H-hydrate epimerase [Acidimicrobiales bacterium]
MADALSTDAVPADSFPTVGADAIGWLDEQQMIEVDRVMVDDLHIELIQMMENAGRNLARLVLERFAPTSAVVYAGSGGNGGGGLVAARHLANAGVATAVELSRDTTDLDGVPRHQYDILQRMGVVSRPGSSPPDGRFDVAIDALIGYSLRGAPRGRTRELIEDVASAADVIVSLDTPSGLDVTTGAIPGVVVAADATMTLALPKVGLAGARQVGDLYLADISVPPAVMRQLGAVPPDFSGSPLLRIVA